MLPFHRSRLALFLFIPLIIAGCAPPPPQIVAVPTPFPTNTPEPVATPVPDAVAVQRWAARMPTPVAKGEGERKKTVVRVVPKLNFRSDTVVPQLRQTIPAVPSGQSDWGRMTPSEVRYVIAFNDWTQQIAAGFKESEAAPPDEAMPILSASIDSVWQARLSYILVPQRYTKADALLGQALMALRRGALQYQLGDKSFGSSLSTGTRLLARAAQECMDRIREAM